jgi:hypothetical protein
MATVFVGFESIDGNGSDNLFPRRQREKPLAVGVVIVVVVEFSIADCDLGMVVWL